MTDGKTILARRKTYKHYSASTIRTISKSDLQQFLLWYDETLLEYRNTRFVLSTDNEIVVYPNMGYNHYMGKTYTPLQLLVEKIGLAYVDALFLLHYFYYKVKKQPLQLELDNWSAQSYSSRLPDGKNETLDLDFIITEDYFQQADVKAYAYKRAIAYLCNTRHIDKDIVLNLIKQGFIMMDKQYNLAFVAYADPNNKKEVIAITKKGMGVERFCPKYVKEHNEGFFYARRAHLETHDYKELTIFESVIDLLSYLTLVKSGRILPTDGHDPNCCYASINGASNTAYVRKLLARYPTIERVNLCLDNDTSGIEAANIITEDLQALPVQVIDTRPRVLLELSRVHGYRKDFNDLLTIKGKGVLAEI